MNSVENVGDNDLGTEGEAGVTVSRSGRVRKKNSMLALYEEDIEEPTKKRRVNKVGRNVKGKGIKGIQQGYHPDISGGSDSYDSLDMLNLTYEVPDIAGEEVIDDSLNEEEEEERRRRFYANKNATIKSQAESTYMNEKRFVKQKKIITTGGAKPKATRKDKGSPRVTAYMLWAKDQRAIFMKKYPHMDFSSLSKKLSDLWATVPQNQKRMWKTKAAKIMRKQANGAENIKNSAGSSFGGTNFTQRKGMKNTTPQEAYLPKRPPGRPPKNPIIAASATPLGPGAHISASINHNNYAGSSNASRYKPVQKSHVSPNYSLARNSTSTTTSFSPQSYKFQVNTATNNIDIAAHLSLLGDSMKKMGAELQKKQDQSVNESLSSLLDSLLCAVGPLVCLTRQVPELNCVPENQLKRILSNVDYIMPGLP